MEPVPKQSPHLSEALRFRRWRRMQQPFQTENEPPLATILGRQVLSVSDPPRVSPDTATSERPSLETIPQSEQPETGDAGHHQSQ